MVEIIVISVVSFLLVRLLQGELEKDLKALFSKWQVLATVILVVLTCAIIFGRYQGINLRDSDLLMFPDDSIYGGLIDPIITLLTFMIAFLFGLYGIRRDWEDKLPHLFTCHFVYNQKILFSFYNAFVSGPDDIRAQVQSLGRDIIGGRSQSLALTSNNTLLPYKIIKQSEHKFYKHWIYIVRLNELPEAFTPTKSVVYSKSDEHKYLCLNKHLYMAYTVDTEENAYPIKGIIAQVSQRPALPPKIDRKWMEGSNSSIRSYNSYPNKNRVETQQYINLQQESNTINIKAI